MKIRSVPMSDKLQPESKNDEAASRFIGWVNGSVDYMPLYEIRALSRHSFAQALCRRLESEGVPWPLTLERVALLDKRSDAEWLLELILSECWQIIRDSFAARPIHSVREPDRILYSPDREIPSLLIYIIISLAPNTAGRLRDINTGELDFLTEVSTHDLSILRHLLSWASEQSEVSKPDIWKLMAERLVNILGTLAAKRNRLVSDYLEMVDRDMRSGRIWPLPDREDQERRQRDYLDAMRYNRICGFAWNSAVGVSLARRMIVDVAPDQLIRIGLEFFKTCLEILAELSKLSANAARSLGVDPSIIRELIKKAQDIDLTQHNDSPSTSRWPEVYAALPFISIENLDQHPLIAGWVIGSQLQAADVPHNHASVAQLLQTSQAELQHAKFCGVALLWADLKQLAEYEHHGRWENQEKVRGVLARLSKHRDVFPEAWAESARELLKQTKCLGTYGADLLTLATVQHSSVRDVLEELAERDPEGTIRDGAAGVLARATGIAMPDEDLQRWLADTAARAFDGVPLFPHPLTRLARTWLGSVDVEEILARQLRQAITRFSDWAQSQGAAQEELVTGVLLRDLEAAFHETVLRLKAGGRKRLARAISVSQRPVSKTEEKRWGCDIALLLNADIRPSVALRLAELIQVKKSEAFVEKPSRLSTFRRGAASHFPDEKWRIDVPQLITLLKMSESSNYWLILSSGEVICVTARWLHGLVGGRHAFNQGSITVGYNEVRHTAVPVEQFLPEIFLGTWAGSLNVETLQFANGENSNMSPRYIFELSIIGDQDRS